MTNSRENEIESEFGRWCQTQMLGPLALPISADFMKDWLVEKKGKKSVVQ